MNVLTIVLVYFALINGTLFVQSQFAQWPGTFSIVNTEANATCNQIVCCCITDLITITQAAVTISWTANVTGAGCNADTMTSATFSLPSGFVIIPTALGLSQTDAYVMTLSSDSNTLTIDDTTNEQCTSIAQRTTVVSTTITTNIPTTTPTTIVSTVVSTTSTVVTSPTTSTNGSGTLRHGIVYYLFFCLLAPLIVFTVGN